PTIRWPVFLTMGLISLIKSPETGVAGLVMDFFLEMGLGAAFGYGFGRLSVTLVKEVKLPAGGLYPVLTTALLLLCYGTTSALHGSGFLAVYVAGILVGNSPIPHRRELMSVHDGFAWLMQIAMFLVLGLLVNPPDLDDVAGVGLVGAVMLCLVARPLSVFIALALTRLSAKEKILISWMGLRGAVPIILATFPLLADVAHAQTFFNATFYIVLVSVLVQGATIPWLARRLDLMAHNREREHAEREHEGDHTATRVIPRVTHMAPSRCGSQEGCG
ncbi:MAG: potassium/proton antiporter, partial [Armatimonadetes bacterium]|nr:potassium/proton antiporter [Armatimonadota bacterium]